MAPFCSCPASLVSRIFFAVGRGCAKCDFFVALRWAPRPFGGARAKKKTPGCFFLLRPRGKAGEGEAPCRHGASPSPAFPRGRSKKKKNLGGVFFFAAAPRGRSLTHCGPGWRCLPLAGVVFVFLLRGGAGPGWCFFFLLWPRPDAHSLTVGWGDFGKARVVFFFLLRPRRVFLDNNKKCLGYYIGSKKTRRGHSKKKSTTSKVFFFALAPCRRPTGLLLPLPFPGPEQKKNTLGGVFFWLWPRAGLKRGFSFPCLSPGPQQKKNTLGGVFFLLWPRAGAQRGFSFPCLSPGPEQKKKNTLCGVVFLRRPRADAHSLTAGLGGDASPSAGWCFFFCCGPARTGVVFFFLLWPRPDAHSLTVGWGDFGKARVVFFFLLRPRRVFLDNNKKCLGYYIGSKKTRRGHSKKKKHHFHPGP